MPSKKKKYNARFPAGRIKKIMQMDDDVGKIAYAVPVVISKSVELFVNNLLQQTANITRAKNAKTVSLAHTKQCILREQKYRFLSDLVENIEDVSPDDDKKSNNNIVIPTTSTTQRSFEMRSAYANQKRVNQEPNFEYPNQVIKEEVAVKKRVRESKNLILISDSSIQSHNPNLSKKSSRNIFEDTDVKSTASTHVSL